MEERTTGIILRTRPLTETSVIVNWLTPDLGRLSTVAKGARRPRSPFAGKLDLCFEAQFSFGRSRKSELHTLREVVLQTQHPTIRQDLSRLYAAAYGAVLIEQGTERETPIPEFHELLKRLLQALDAAPPNASLIFSLELKFLDLIGVAPPLEEHLPPELARAGRELESASLCGLAAVRLPAPASTQLSALLRKSIGMALEKLPPQREKLFQSLT